MLKQLDSHLFRQVTLLMFPILMFPVILIWVTEMFQAVVIFTLLFYYLQLYAQNEKLKDL